MIVLGPFCAWWHGDPLSLLSPLPGWEVISDAADELLESLTHSVASELQDRRRNGHRPYVALLNDKAVAYGWVATCTAEIGALGLSLVLSPGDRYLWDFFTHPDWRGRGIYPRLLRAVLGMEKDGERFWIGYDAPNVASARGIAKVGFQIVVQIVCLNNGSLALVPVGPPERVAAAARVLGLPVLDRPSDGCGTSGGR